MSLKSFNANAAKLRIGNSNASSLFNILCTVFLHDLMVDTIEGYKKVPLAFICFYSFYYLYERVLPH